MFEKIIIIPLETDFLTMREFLKFVSQQLQQEIGKLPTFAKVKAYQEVSLIELKEDHISYRIRFGEIIEADDKKKKHLQSEETRKKISTSIIQKAKGE